MDYSNDRLADYRGDSGIGRGSLDVPFLLIVLLLLTVGVVMVLSASFARAYYSAATKHTSTFYFTRQLFFAVTGVAIMLLASRFPIGFYRRFSGVLLLFSIVMLLLVLIGGVRANGARRWFAIGSITATGCCPSASWPASSSACWSWSPTSPPLSSSSASPPS